MVHSGFKQCFSNGLSWLFILGCLNLFLTTQLNHDANIHKSRHRTPPPSANTFDANPSNDAKKPQETPKIQRKVFDGINMTQGRWDQSRNFKIFDHVFTGSNYDKLSREFNVTLATQSSLDKIYWLGQVSRTWNGPISLAVFAPDIEFELTAKFLQHLIDCHPKLSTQLAVHLFYDFTKPPRSLTESAYLKSKEINCSDDVVKILETFFATPEMKSKKFQKWRTAYPYPQNLARNIARKGANTAYTMSTDIDIMPSAESAETLKLFLAQNTCAMCAYVLATYELQSSAEFPQSKTQLMKEVKMQRARPFHYTVFKMNQHATNFSLYEKKQEESSLHISHTVRNFEFFYEPFYISLDTAPPFDERFIGYGFTRNTQAYEMWMAGWTFEVLSPIFAIHWGFQKKIGRPAWRERQNNRNRVRFKGFKAEVMARYGKTEKPKTKGIKKDSNKSIPSTRIKQKSEIRMH